MTAETPILETPTGKPRARALGIPFAGIAEIGRASCRERVLVTV